MIKQYIKGSILDAPQKYIAHGVNCQNVMGSGVARVLFEEYPSVKTQYHMFCDDMTIEGDTAGLLGYICTALGEKTVFNCFTQDSYGYDGKKHVDYEAVYKCFIGLTARLKGTSTHAIAIPKIGCGLAGGNWDIVKQIIDDATGDDLDVFVYYLEDK